MIIGGVVLLAIFKIEIITIRTLADMMEFC